MTISQSMCKDYSPPLIVAVVGATATPCTVELDEIVAELENKRVNNCLIVDGLKPAVELVSVVSECGSELTVIGCGEERGDDTVEIMLIEPIRDASMLPVNDIVRSLWPSLTGSTSPLALAEALRLVHNRAFTVFLLHCKTGSCRPLAEEIITHICKG